MNENEISKRAKEIFLTVFRDVSVEKLHYKHFGNPNKVSFPILLHYEDGVAVGMNAFMGYSFIVNHELIKGVKSCEGAVLPEYRGKGIFSKLNRQGEQMAQQQEVSFLFGAPNPNSYPGLIKLGWKHHGDLHTYAMLIDPRGCAEVFGGIKPPRFITRIWSAWIKKKLKKISKICPDTFVEESEECLLSDEDYLALNSLALISTEKSLPYYKWKIDNNQGRKFKYCYAKKNGAIQAYVVYSESTRQGFNVVDIVDWQCVRDQGNAYVYFALIFLLKARDSIIIKINDVNSLAQESRTLKKIGFFDISTMPFVKPGVVPGKIPIVFKPCSDIVGKKMGDFSQWQLRYLDSDTILN